MKPGCLIALMLTFSLPAFAQDRYPRPGEPGAVDAPGLNPGQAGVENKKDKPLRASSNRTRSTPGPDPAQRRQASDPVARFESQDFGVPAVNRLHRGAMHGNTPTAIPGGRVIGTRALSASMRGQRNPVYVFHVLGQSPMLPGAVFALQASNPGSFADQTQAQMTQYLQQLTRGNPNAMLVFYCSGPKCWMSYNAALRAINAGYKNVRWYRGGLKAWRMAGLSLQ